MSPLDGPAATRADVFSPFNWVNYGVPAANVPNQGTFGRITTRSAIRVRCSWR